MVHEPIIYRPLQFEHRSPPAPVADDEGQLNFILALVLGLVLLVVLLVIGVAVGHTRAKSAQAVQSAQAVRPVARHAMCNPCIAEAKVAAGLIVNTPVINTSD